MAKARWKALVRTRVRFFHFSINFLKSSFRENTPKESNGRDMPRAQREEFEQGLRTLVPIRELIGDLMALCLEQSDHAGEIVLGLN